MNKNTLVAALALVVVGGWPVGIRAQEAPPSTQYSGPVVHSAKPLTPEELQKERESVAEYCRTHQCGSAVVGPNFLPGAMESADRAIHRIPSGFAPGVANPNDLIQCERDPAHPNGPEICYRAGDHSRVYSGTPGPN